MTKTRLQHFKPEPDAPVREVARVVVTKGVKTIIDTEGLSTVWSQATFCGADGAVAKTFENKASVLRAKLVDPASPAGATKVAAKAAQHARQKDRE